MRKKRKEKEEEREKKEKRRKEKEEARQERERQQKSIAERSKVCQGITDSTGCWGKDPQETQYCKHCEDYTKKLFHLAEHIVNLCIGVAKSFTDDEKQKIAVHCLGCIQSDSSQGLPGTPAYRGAAAHRVNIHENLETRKGRAKAMRDLHAYLVNTCLHGAAGYLAGRNSEETYRVKIPFSPVGHKKIVQVSRVTLVFEPLDWSSADKIYKNLCQADAVTPTTVRQFTLDEIQTTADQFYLLNKDLPNKLHKVEITFDDFGPQIPQRDACMMQIPFRNGETELHRKLCQSVWEASSEANWEPIGKTDSYDVVKWRVIKSS